MNCIIRKVKLFLHKKKWEKKNKHNRTSPGNLYDIDRVKVGKYTYGQLNVRIFGNKNVTLTIGNFCSIADESIFLLDGGHNINTISTYPFKQNVLGINGESLAKGNIVVGDDVWIGYRSTILSGVHIGQGAVVAACSVVTKDVPPYAIVGGVPAKIIKYRFNEEMIRELCKINYDKLTKKEIEKHIYELYSELQSKDQLTWLYKYNK